MFKTATANGGSKPSGMDMMIQSILKGMGVSPDALTGYIESGKTLATQFVVAMQNTSARLDAIEAEQRAQRALLQSIYEATATAPGVDELYPPALENRS
jgi:ABC-type tungstate transport system permease subunit